MGRVICLWPGFIQIIPLEIKVKKKKSKRTAHTRNVYTVYTHTQNSGAVYINVAKKWKQWIIVRSQKHWSMIWALWLHIILGDEYQKIMPDDTKHGSLSHAINVLTRAQEQNQTHASRQTIYEKIIFLHRIMS